MKKSTVKFECMADFFNQMGEGGVERYEILGHNIHEMSDCRTWEITVKTLPMSIGDRFVPVEVTATLFN